MELNLRPRPVSVTTPTMMPAPAQVAATLSTASEPPSSARVNFEPSTPRTSGSRPRHRSYESSALSRRRKKTARSRRRAAPEDAGAPRHDGRPEHRQLGREAPQHEGDDRDERQE